MSTRKPLVIVSGQVERLQSGDLIANEYVTPPILNATNDNGSTINICEAVYLKSDGDVDLAKADAIATADVLGVVYDATIASAAEGNIAIGGIMTATTGQWDAVTGDSGGLTPGSVYYLDASTAGNLTTTAPDTDGQVVTRVGKALSATQMYVNPEAPILL